MPVTEINTAVSPSLHPTNVESLDGYGPATSGYVSKALEAFETCYAGLDAIHKARAAAQKNPTLNDAGKLLATADFADKHLSIITKKFDSAREMLAKAIAANESMLNEPLKASAERVTIASEIRAYCKGLSTEKRNLFFNERLRVGDLESLQSILGAPSYLSGLTDEERSIRTRHYHSVKSPDIAARLKVMTGALALIDKNAPLLWGELEKATGANSAKVQKLRQATTEAEKAFILRGDKSAA